MGTHASFVCYNDKEQFEWNRLYNNASSMVFVEIWWNLHMYTPIDLELVCFVLLYHEQRMVKQEHYQLPAIAL
jgi:hypothetical protein